jgi:D-alanyl-D-alanine carboxypeptidase/D-alanyl-D-alanine-endopeptidase (penicillin-binding protein 4)
MTNQVFLTMGAELYGAPATLEKSQKAMDAYFKKHSLPPIVMGDGSGLSRQTTLSARQMAAVLEVVEANRHIFDSRDDGSVLAKTGTMSDIKTLAGFMERPEAPDQPLSFVILLNGSTYKGSTRDAVLDLLKHEFITSSPSAGR